MAPVITTLSPTATSVTITWTQSEFSLPVLNYTVSLMQVTGSGQVLCPSFQNNTAVTVIVNTTLFTGLQEFSNYNVTVTARFDQAHKSTSMNFTTLSAGKMIILYI